jgi:GNAT superfamily N-acetyltransferase
LTQLGIEPSLQRRGLGSRLINFVEQRAADLGATEIALHTAEPAAQLIALYEARGYRLVGHEQWKHTNYRSVILSKSLRRTS